MSIQTDPERSESRILHRFTNFKGQRILEVGCGDGRMTWEYAGATRSTTGIDLDAEALRVATLDRPSGLPVSFARADSIHLPFGKEQFDIALLAWSF